MMKWLGFFAAVLMALFLIKGAFAPPPQPAAVAVPEQEPLPPLEQNTFFLAPAAEAAANRNVRHEEVQDGFEKISEEDKKLFGAATD